jgi:glucose-1-phosphate thymidylyltransferase
MTAMRAKGLFIADDGLAPVANKPLVLYGLDAMRSAGIREVGIAADAPVAESIRELIGQELGGGMRVRYLPSRPGAEPGECLAAAAPFLGDSPCVAQLRDGLVRGDVRPLVEELVRDDLDALLLLDPAGETLTSLDDQRLLRLAGGDSSDCLAGVHVLGPRLVQEAARGGCLAEQLDRVVAAGGRARTRCFEGAWKQVARSDELLEANRLVLDDLHAGPWRGELIDSRVEGRVSIGPGAVLESTVVRGPAVIGSRARLRHAYIGPYTSIGDEVEVEGAEIEHSIVMPGAVIQNLDGRLEGSVVGRGAKLYRDFALPRAMRVRLADGDEIALS